MKSISNWVAAVLVFSSSAMAQGSEPPIKVMAMDPLSGPFGLVGTIAIDHIRFAVDRVNARGGVLGGRKLEVVPYDNKMSPADALSGFNSALDQGIPIVFLNVGAALASAVNDATKRHNARNPNNPVLFFTTSQESTLTDKSCDYYMFRFYQHSDMGLVAMVDGMSQDKSVKQVYLLNQDYSYGRGAAETARVLISEKLPLAKIVGEELHPLGKVKDFSPYVAKINASGADTVVTVNWGADLQLLVRAVRDAGLGVKFYTLNAGGFGTPTAIGEAGIERIVDTTTMSMNLVVTEKNAELKSYGEAFKSAKRHDFYYVNMVEMVEMLAKAINKAGSADPKAIANALHGMEHSGLTGKFQMRAEDHQLVAPMFVNVFQKDLTYDVEGTGLGWNPIHRVEGSTLATALPPKCTVSVPK